MKFYRTVRAQCSTLSTYFQFIRTRSPTTFLARDLVLKLQTFFREIQERNFSGNLQPLASVRRFQQSTEQEITQPPNNEVHELQYRQHTHPKEQTKVTTEARCENETNRKF